MKGLFITFEGIDGCGKTTQAQAVFRLIRRKKLPAIFTREPGGTAISEKIRDIILDPKNHRMSWKTELLLYNASRTQHLDEKILPALKKGAIVICDRFFDATLAYQGWGRNLDRPMIRALHKIATGNLQPDLTLIFDLPAAVARKRMKDLGKKKDRLEKEQGRFQEKVRSGYRSLARKYPHRCRLINTNRPIEETRAEVMEILNRYLNRKKR